MADEDVSDAILTKEIASNEDVPEVEVVEEAEKEGGLQVSNLTR